MNPPSFLRISNSFSQCTHGGRTADVEGLSPRAPQVDMLSLPGVDLSAVLYMNGTPEFPQCDDSAQTVDALNACKVAFVAVDILELPYLRQALQRFWPIFPQLYAHGELIGGHDIVLDLFRRGELVSTLERAADFDYTPSRGTRR